MKRGFRTLKSPAAISNYAPVELNKEAVDLGKLPTDPYFPLQWYLRNTGQNGGKVRLDLNVQAAWDQGITGKNVTTAIMDDGTAKSSQTFFSPVKSISAETFPPFPSRVKAKVFPRSQVIY
jgi:subtilisin family serine protease